MITSILLMAVDFSMCPSDFLKQIFSSWRPTPWVQQYGALHQFGRNLDYFFCVGLVYFLVWKDSLLFRFLVSLWNCVIILVREAISASLVTSWLEYLATWYVGIVLASVRFVTATLYSTFAWTRLEILPLFQPCCWIYIRLVAPFFGTLEVLPGIQ